MPNLAFVILTWNSERFIGSCISSILDSSLTDCQILVVDNGSKDKTLEIIEQFNNPRITVLPQKKNLGTTKTRNLALRLVTKDTPYVCILDSDTQINSLAMNRLIDTLSQDKAIGIVGPCLKSPDGMVQDSGKNLPTLAIKLKKALPLKSINRRGEEEERPDFKQHTELQEVGYLISACWVFRRSLLDEVGYLDERIFYAPEDVDYCVRVQRAGYKVVLDHGASIIHDCQRISKQKLISKTNLRHAAGLAYYFRKHRYLFNSDKVLNR